MDRRALLQETITDWRRERPDLQLDAMETVLRLGQVAHAAAAVLEAECARHGVTLGEFDVLAALRRSGANARRTPGVLAWVAMVSPAGMTNRLDRLEAAGLVVRGPDPDDRRGSLVSLTAKGRTTSDRVVGSLAALDTELFARLSATERRALDRTLDKLLAHVESRAVP